jgi:hypothetical protein
VRTCPVCGQVLTQLVHSPCKERLLASLVETPRRRLEELFDLYLSAELDARVRSWALSPDETTARIYADLARAYAELGMGADVLTAVVGALRLHDADGTAYGAAVEALSVLLERRGLDAHRGLDALVRGG